MTIPSTFADAQEFAMFSATLGFAVLLGAVVGAEPESPPSKESPIKIDCRGRLRIENAAVAGGMTGMRVDFLGIKWDLNFKDQVCLASMKDNHKKHVTVAGKLRLVRGTERVRWVIDVDKISLRDPGQSKEGADLSMVGTIKKQEPANGATAVMIDADGTTLPLDLTGEKSLSETAEQLMQRPAEVSGEVIPLPEDDKRHPQPLIRVKKLEPVEKKTAKK